MRREHYDLGNPPYLCDQLDADIETNEEIIDEFTGYYLRHLGKNTELANGYLEMISGLKKENESYGRIQSFCERSNKNGQQLAGGDRTSAFEPW